MKEHKLTVGLDIGTTSISAAVVKAGQTVKTVTVQSGAAIASESPWEHRQNVNRIFECAKTVLDDMLDRFPEISAIGFTGQMHGIVYHGEDNEALSDLYTWQDERAGIEENGKSVVKALEEETGYRLAPGYGMATHAYLLRHGQAPKQASGVCTVMDFAAAKLCGVRPVIHATNAASLGFFAAKTGDFDRSAMQKAGMDTDILPEVVSDDAIVGYYRGIPVHVPIGDNQASVFGAIGMRTDTVLANFGTGSQISVICNRTEETMRKQSADIEVRPYLDGTVLLCGSALCGGRAYQIMERFFRSYAVACGLPDAQQYEIMNCLAEKGFAKTQQAPACALKVKSTFCGTRSDPTLRGSVENMAEDNMTPELLLSGTLTAMAQELYEHLMRMNLPDICHLAAAGNGVRKNPALQKALQLVFGMEPELTQQDEEAAYGAAMFAARTR